MKQIYSLSQQDECRALVQVDADGEIAYEESIAIRATTLCGERFSSDYSPVALTWGSSRRKKTSDVQTMLTPFILFSKKATVGLSDLLHNSGQFLSVQSPVHGMVAFHITKVINSAVDLPASTYKVYSEGTVFSKIVLLQERVEGVHIFRLKESPATVFVSSEFKQRVSDVKLKGFNFTEQALVS